VDPKRLQKIKTPASWIAKAETLETKTSSLLLETQPAIATSFG